MTVYTTRERYTPNEILEFFMDIYSTPLYQAWMADIQEVYAANGYEDKPEMNLKPSIDCSTKPYVSIARDTDNDDSAEHDMIKRVIKAAQPHRVMISYNPNWDTRVALDWYPKEYNTDIVYYFLDHDQASDLWALEMVTDTGTWYQQDAETQLIEEDRNIGLHCWEYHSHTEWLNAMLYDVVLAYLGAVRHQGWDEACATIRAWSCNGIFWDKEAELDN